MLLSNECTVMRESSGVQSKVAMTLIVVEEDCFADILQLFSNSAFLIKFGTSLNDMNVIIYRTVGHLDRQFITKRWFSNAIKAKNFCDYIAPKLYGYGVYEYTIINN